MTSKVITSAETLPANRKRGRDNSDEPIPFAKQRHVAKQWNKQRRAILAGWEARNKDLCWLVVWLTFRINGGGLFT